jgi:hypothetical protein
VRRPAGRRRQAAGPRGAPRRIEASAGGGGDRGKRPGPPTRWHALSGHAAVARGVTRDGAAALAAPVTVRATPALTPVPCAGPQRRGGAPVTRPRRTAVPAAAHSWPPMRPRPAGWRRPWPRAQTVAPGPASPSPPSIWTPAMSTGAWPWSAVPGAILGQQARDACADAVRVYNADFPGQEGGERLQAAEAAAAPPAAPRTCSARSPPLPGPRTGRGA